MNDSIKSASIISESFTPKPLWALKAGDVAPDGSGPVDLDSLPGKKWVEGSPTTTMAANKIYIESEKGEIMKGLLHGPAAMACAPDGNTWIADTLNSRILSVPDKGSSKVIIDLSAVRAEAGLKRLPLPIDIAFGGEGFKKAPEKTLPADYTVWIADASNNCVLSFSISGKFLGAIHSSGKSGDSGSFRQINRIHCDALGRLFVEDLSQSITLCFTAEKSYYLSYKITSAAVDRFGNIHQILYDDNVMERHIAVYDENGNPLEVLATIKASEPIQYVRPVGFDSKGRLHVTWDTASGRFYQAFAQDGTPSVIRMADAVAEGMDMTTPEWVLPDGSIRTVKATARGIVVLEILPALK
ncbi:MAG: hypothetical protein CVV64_16005 [Candidatus Wallbacteria bacterium HGW-Wallbacteria-1]|jgi:hypothetical protein|uniref:SMP-30/Gluconolactonase/LRE-like region domain-containing protein n=1 Tax=Candidatus Wallbacteria bacterium HGW-Wallbacteria-1 TaxID=2013854 RepID=A0A2N1PL35_9BACT|nr:MAG: hypothetical protein CVV64_16005 [Candidatus Wallbacteria bacterium HGW-Wallbacteria-1]